jgi:cyclopropane fatty-acyl-phospholipid synthase-like methyltransferase
MKQDPRVKLYSHWAASYDRQIETGSAPISFEGYDQVLDEALTLAQTIEGMKILDLGTGTCNLAARFLASGCEVWGIDFSAEMIARAKAKLPNLHIVKANINNRVWPKDLARRFDRVVSAYALHAFDLQSKIRLLTRIFEKYLSLNGQIIIADIAYRNQNARTQAQVYWGRLWSDDDYYWSADETISACRNVQLTCNYHQVSSCAGVFVIKGN